MSCNCSEFWECAAPFALGLLSLLLLREEGRFLFLLCPFPQHIRKASLRPQAQERVAGCCPKLCKLLLNFTPAVPHAVNVTGYLVLFQRSAQNSQITTAQSQTRQVAGCQRHQVLKLQLEDEGRVGEYKEAAAMALCLRAPEVCPSLA